MPAAALAWLTAAAFVIAVIGVITGGNSLISVPLLMLAGMRSREAIATNMLAVTCMTLSATLRFDRERLVDRKLALPLCALSLATSIVGARLTVLLSDRVVHTTIAVSMVAMLVFLAARTQFGVTATATSRARRAIGYVAATVLGVYGGLFSGGYTTVLTFVCVICFGVPLMQAVGLTKLVNFVSSAAATAVFIQARLIDWRVGVPLSLAMLIGGWAGAHLSIRRGHRFVRAVFLSVVAALAIKLLVIDTLLR
jgi:uncharacterized membrane protein YfcA